MSIETTRCPRCESTCVVHLPESIGFNQWICNQCSHQWDFASPNERALVPKHLTGGRIEQFLEEFLAIKVVIKGAAEMIWNGCANAHQAISMAGNEDKPRVFAEQVDLWRDRLIGLQEALIIDRLLPLITKYRISSNEQIWLFQACHESWRPVSDGYVDWFTVAIRGELYGAAPWLIPEWAWRLRGAPRDVVRLDVAPSGKASSLFHSLAGTLQRDLMMHRKEAIAKAFLAGKARGSSTEDRGGERLQTQTNLAPQAKEEVRVKTPASAASHPRPANDNNSDQRDPIPDSGARHSSAPLSEFDATVGKLMVEARTMCLPKHLPKTEILKIAALLDDKGFPLRTNLEREAARTNAEYNQRHPMSAIKNWRTATAHPLFRRAVRKRFSRAEEKYKKMAPSVIASSAGTPRPTI